MRIKNIEISFSNIYNWPTSFKVAIYIIFFLILSGVFYWFDSKSQIENLTQIQKKERQLKIDLENKHNTVANLSNYKQQLKSIEDILQGLVKQLPSTAEISNLIDNISETSKAANLDIISVLPQKEINQNFYIIYPIQLTVQGRYHQMGNFVSKLAALDRIIIPGNYVISTNKSSDATNLANENLTLVMQINTYYSNTNPQLTKNVSTMEQKKSLSASKFSANKVSKGLFS